MGPYIIKQLDLFLFSGYIFCQNIGLTILHRKQLNWKLKSHYILTTKHYGQLVSGKSPLVVGGVISLQGGDENTTSKDIKHVEIIRIW